MLMTLVSIHYGSLSLSNADSLQSQLSACVCDSGKWMTAKRLQVNALAKAGLHLGLFATTTAFAIFCRRVTVRSISVLNSVTKK